MEFTSNKPYLLKAIYEWVVDNNATPHVVIFADNPDVLVPQQFVDEGRIILNVSPSAAQNLVIDQEGMSFSARFSGKPYNIYSPLNAVMALYASESGEGMSFDIEAENDIPPPPPKGPEAVDGDNSDHQASTKPSKGKSKRPTLKVVK